jgi:hypothetical protein
MLPSMSEVFAIEASDIDQEVQEADDDMPSVHVTWPDGRADTLPRTDTDYNLRAGAIIENRPTLHLGYVNQLAGMTSGYDSEDLARLDSDIFYSRIGDVMGGECLTHYLRGEFSLVVQHWLTQIVADVIPASLPWDGLVLATYYGLLSEVMPNANEDGYEANLFSLTPDEELAGVLIDFGHSLPETDVEVLVQIFEAAGCTWPRSVTEGDEDATAAWQERIRTWNGQ